MLKPKHTLNVEDSRLKATRQFTDRDNYKVVFKNAVEELQNHNEGEPKVVVYYGVGGIGKTSLRKELCNKFLQNKSKFVYSVVDFEVPNYRDVESALFVLKNSLNKRYKIQFPIFDIAYAAYWKKINPHIPMTEDTFPLFEEGSVVFDIISALGNIPFLELIPKVLQGTTKSSKYIKKWLTKRIQKILVKIENMEPQEIKKMFPAFWAEDFKNYLNKKQVTPVVFFDTYEALWENKITRGNYFIPDDWVEELVLNIPQVLWVILGREKLTWQERNEEWEPHLDQHIIGELSKKDTAKFLNSCKIYNEDIQEAIINSSKGVPFYLDLTVDSYYEIINNSGRQPSQMDFHILPYEVTQRFLKYLTPHEVETLKILSIPRFWDDDLFEKLIDKFKTGYPLNGFNNLCRFSFISNKGNDNYWSMHELMKESLQNELSENGKSNVHRFLFQHYNEILKNITINNMNEEKKNALLEGFYHGKFILSIENFINWFDGKANKFKADGQYSIIEDLYEKMISILENSCENHENYLVYVLISLLELYYIQGKYKKSETLCLSCIELCDKLIQQECDNYKLFLAKGSALYYIGKIKTDEHNHKEAIRYMEKAKDIYNILLMNNSKNEKCVFEKLKLLIDLGKVLVFEAEYENAKLCYGEALKTCKTIKEIDSDNCQIYSFEGLVLERLGEVYAFDKSKDKAGELYKKSLNAYNKALEFKDKIDYITTLSNKGMTLKRLAENYREKNDILNSIKSFKEAIKIYESVLTISPNFIEVYRKKGHASIDLMDTQIIVSQYEEALKYFNVGVDAFKEVLKRVENDASSLNRIGSAYRTLGELNVNQSNYYAAEENLKEGVKYNFLAVEYSPNYTYGYNSKGKTFAKLGDLYMLVHKENEAHKYYREAIKSFDKVLELSPNAIYAVDNKREVVKKINNNY